MRLLPFVLILALMLAWVLPELASAQSTHYIRQVATGRNDGSDWNNAYTNLPTGSSWIRGGTYYIAAGSYTPSGYWTTPLDGTKVITLKKATVGEHGTNTGWSDSYASGQVVITGNTEILAGYWTIDGAYGGGPGNWTGPYGLKFVANYCGGMGNNAIIFSMGGSHVTIRHCEITSTCTAQDVAACPGIGSGIVSQVGLWDSLIEFNYLHDYFGSDIQMAGWSNTKIQYNHFTKNTFGPNYCHGNPISENGGSSNIDLAYNYFYDNDGGQPSVHGGNPEIISSDWRIYGNIYEHTDDIMRCMWDSRDFGNKNVCNNWKFFNNIIVDFRGNYFSMSIDKTTSGVNEAINNIYYNCLSGTAWWHNSVPDNNWYYGCGPSTESNLIIGTGDPFVNSSGHNFHLKAGTNAIDTGKSLGTPYNIDMDGVSRPQGSGWDMGAYEYGTAPVCTPHNSFSCYSGDVYWYDSCGTKEELKEDCGSNSCVGNACQSSQQYLLPEQAIEAESGILASPMQAGLNSSASEGQYIYTPTSYQGSASFTFEISNPGKYRMEVKLLTPLPDMAGANSFYVGLDSEAAQGNNAYAYDTLETPAFAWDNVSLRGPLGNVTWSQYNPMVWDLTQGLHTFTFYGREANTWLDQIILRRACGHRSDSSCDGCVNSLELTTFISLWYLDSSNPTLKELIEAIGLWKRGCS